jgi:hypothetical protein
MKYLINKKSARQIMNRLFDLYEKTFCTLKRCLFLIISTIGLLLLIMIKGNSLLKFITFLILLPIAFFLYSYIYKDNRLSSKEEDIDKKE